MIIRHEQMRALEQDQLERFEKELLAHLKTFDPFRCDIVGDDSVREVIRLGMQNAAEYGLSQGDTIRLYVDLMFMFGSYFDTDPQYPWATESLNDPLLPDPLFRAAALHEKMLDYLQKVVGAGQRYFLDATLQFQRFLSKSQYPAAADLRDFLLERFHTIHPQKAVWLGEQRLYSIVLNGLGAAAEYGVKSVKGQVLFVLLAFAIGHGFAHDALYPWVSRTLNDAQMQSLNARAEDLERTGLIYFDRVLKSMGQPVHHV